jgi:hypothetical protein
LDSIALETLVWFDSFARLFGEDGEDVAARRRESLAFSLAMNCFFVASALFV